MPWRGPNEPGEFPTLGYDVGEWMQENLVIPDGYHQGDPFLLTDEMWKFVLHFFRLVPTAQPYPYPDTFQHFGGQLRRSQKWGKDPFLAALMLADAFAPTRFAGWDADGEPVGRPYPTPLIVCLGMSEAQTKNTWRPLLAMIRNGPLIDTPGIDAGETRVVLPGGGMIEPVTTSAKSRLGAPMSFAGITEPHLFTAQGGYRDVTAAVKRNVAGMDGRWAEMTNAWDPTENSEAQVTAESGDPRVYVDNIPPHRVEDLTDTEAVYAELLRQYGDSARERGGWVNVRGRILPEILSSRHTEPDKRRYWLNEIVVGQGVLVRPEAWDAKALPGVGLAAGEAIALGFDGSKYRDGTALIASRMSDGHIVTIHIWERPKDAGRDWTVPSAQVHRVLVDTFAAYWVTYMFADPYRWQDYLNAWSARWPGHVAEFPTNVEYRFDKAIERFMTAFGQGEITHDGNEVLTRHVKDTVTVKGSRKKPRPGDDESIAEYYLKLAKRADGVLIDGSVGAVLAYAARGQAIEDGVPIGRPAAPATAAVPAANSDDNGGGLWRPRQRLNL